MSFLRDENLTFHRFATDDSRRPSEDLTGSTRHNTMATNTTDRHENNFPPNVWTTSTSSSKSNFTMDTNEFQYIPGGVHDISSKNLTLANGSTAKLLPADDQSNKQVRWIYYYRASSIRSMCDEYLSVCVCVCAHAVRSIRVGGRWKKKSFSLIFQIIVVCTHRFDIAKY